MDVYQKIVRPLLFRFEPEAAHDLALGFLRIGARFPSLLRTVLGAKPRQVPHEILGFRVSNRIGLAAGLDKNGVALNAWEALGFGFVEIGTITAQAQPGNPRPRMFRYPSHQALINRMGFNNDGAVALAARLKQFKTEKRWPLIPVGINIGKSKATPLEEAPQDYVFSFQHLLPYADYFVVNVSSPNTPGLRQLQDARALEAILKALLSVRPDNRPVPVLVKLAPDLEREPLQEAISVASAAGADGFIATNTTLDHSSLPKESDETGGLSGAPLTDKAGEILQIARNTTSLPLIGCGGIMTAQDAANRFAAGADLIQLYTGFVYSGPSLLREISMVETGRSN